MAIFKTKAFWKRLLLYFYIIVGIISIGTLIHFTQIYLEEKKWYQHEKTLYEHNIKLFNLGMQDMSTAHMYAKQLYNSETSRSFNSLFFKGDFEFQEKFDGTSDDIKGKALRLFLISAQKGNIHSQIFLADWYYENRGNENGAHWYLIAAKNGSAYAQGRLGHCYKYGCGVTQNFEKAIYWTKLGAKNGSAYATYQLGNLYESGLAYYKDLWNTTWFNGEYYLLKGGNIISEHQNLEKTVDTIFLQKNQNKAEYYWELANSKGYNGNKPNELGTEI